MTNLRQAIRYNRVGLCLECGKCSAVCPITRWTAGEFTSPRRLAEAALSGQLAHVMQSPLFWSCLTCRRCSGLCPADVHFSEFIRDARRLAQAEGVSGPSTHGAVTHTWARIMTHSDRPQNRLAWLPEALAVSGTSDTVFFVGCLPHFEALFRDLGFEGIDIAVSGIRILNHLGIAPQVLADERCCGHDQLWQGDFETFRALAQLNIARLKKTGAGTIVTACPECARTLAVDYPQHVGALGIKILHISQVLATGFSEGALAFSAGVAGRRVTYHDPCRLGRHLGVYADPRAVIDALGFDRREMAYRQNTAQCCGTSCWTACGRVNKQIQVERLREAISTGAELLVTACLKCQIHFRCAQQDLSLRKEIKIPIQDITTLAAERLQDACGRRQDQGVGTRHPMTAQRAHRP